jgi:hypothetical protein
MIWRSSLRTFKDSRALLTSSGEGVSEMSMPGPGRGGNGMILSGSGFDVSFLFQNARVVRFTKIEP